MNRLSNEDTNTRDDQIHERIQGENNTLLSV